MTKTKEEQALRERAATYVILKTAITKALARTVVISITILLCWYMLEYQQFDRLQWDRTGDGFAFLAFTAALFLAETKAGYYELRSAWNSWQMKKETGNTAGTAERRQQP